VRQRLITLDALADELRQEDSDEARARLAEVLEERRQLIEEMSDLIRRGTWTPPE
jgi:hypothetical protein